MDDYQIYSRHLMRLISERYAAIDIGSNAARLLLSEVFEPHSGPYFRKISGSGLWTVGLPDTVVSVSFAWVLTVCPA